MLNVITTCWLCERCPGWNESTSRETILFTTGTLSSSIRAGGMGGGGGGLVCKAWRRTL